MTLTYVRGNIFEDTAEALVVPVNCVGVAGKGLALDAARRFPKWEKHYRDTTMSPGLCDWYQQPAVPVGGPLYICAFPTKRHWKDDSSYTMVCIGLGSMLWSLRQYGLKSVALPALGCGLGGLRWNAVRGYIQTAESYMPDVEFHVYEPQEERA